ncbi:MAG: hypothetical protein LBP94_07470, partial [Zoogloeaceae bacterium]|jgi:uncharacterized protein YhdP|nr:hypothetical protein [Zoogloeaceae bacterium]
VRGYGGLRLWFDLERDSVMAVTADVRLSRTITRLASDLPKLDMEFVDGRIVARRERDGFALQTQRLFLATYDGARLEPADIAFSWRQEESSGIGRGAASANVLDLGTLAVLAKYFPFDAALRKKLIAWNPRGRVRDLQLGWTETPAALSAYLIRTRFENLSLNAQQGLPLGFSGLTGTIEADERGGELNLDMRAATLVLPQVFEQPSIALASLKANAGWTVRDGLVDVQLQNAKFENADAAGDASGRYRYGGKGAGEIDLSAKLTRADGRAVWRYMPLAINADVRAWLKESIRNAQTNATLRLKGNLDHFPFADGSGIFEVKAPLRKATLRYDPNWPAIENISGDLLVSGSRLLVGVQQASAGGVQLADVKAEFADLGKPQPLIVTGTARGQVSEFLSFIATSPVSGYIGNATEGMQIDGNGELRLRLDLPLENLSATKVDGRFRFLNNRLSYDAELPSISDINGELHFTEHGLSANKIRAAMLGGPLTVDIKTVDGQITILANGTVQAAALRQQFALPLLDHLTGAATWRGTIQTKKDSLELRFKSSLTGISSGLPEPFNKAANETMPLVFELKPMPESTTRARRTIVNRTPGAREQWDFSLGNILRGQIIRRHEKGGEAVIQRGLLVVGGANAELPRRGVLLAIKTPIDIDAWQQVIGGSGNGSAASGSNTTGIDQIDLNIDSLQWRGRELGRLEAHAGNAQGIWGVNFQFHNEDGKVEGTSSWVEPRGNTPGVSALDFRLTTSNVEKLLARFGYPDAIQKGEATLTGSLYWQGPPTGIDYSSLGGGLSLDAKDGQFKTLEPGVGRLLGVLSLQSLPRRITLDFRDVFSEGFAFDAIKGKAVIMGGVMNTREFEITGPAARVLLDGTANIADETQDLKVRVQPTLGETIATGMVVVNPIFGVAIWLLDKVLGNPLDKAFAFNYAITGSWAEPKVEKITAPAPEAPPDSPQPTP